VPVEIRGDDRLQFDEDGALGGHGRHVQPPTRPTTA
jgi:hypothetical protein